MMHRSILVLPAFLFVSLLLTIGYAVLGLGGPESALRRARAAMDQHDHATALRLLDRVMADAGANDGQIREQAARMRAATYEELGDQRRAIDDLTYLIDKLRVGGRELVHDRIRLANQLGFETEDQVLLGHALGQCRHWLATNRDDHVAMAQAGRNRQSVVDLEFAAWRAEFDHQLPASQHREIEEQLHRAVYGVFDDSQIPAVVAALTARVTDLVPGFASTAERRIRSLRRHAAEARKWFLQSLAGPRSNATAYTGIAAQLQRAGDDDTLLMVAHSHLQRARPIEQIAPAVDIAEVHARHGRFRALLELTDRILPGSHLIPNYRAGTLNTEALHLVVLRSIALRAIGAQAPASAFLVHIYALLNSEPEAVHRLEWPMPMVHLCIGLLTTDSSPSERKGAVKQLRIFADHAAKMTWNRELLVTHGFERWIALAPPEERPRICARWARIDQTSPRPAHQLARYAIADGKPERAQGALSRAIADLPGKDRSLELLSEVEQAIAGLDLDAVINRAAALQVPIPDEVGPFPALTLGVARRAMVLGHHDIALACIRRARTLYPGTRLPRYLHAELLLQTGKPQDAEATLELLLDEAPDDKRALSLMLQARAANNRGIEDLRFATILSGDPDLASMRYLARRWLERGEAEQVIELAERATSAFGVDLEIQILATRALMLDPNSDRKRLLAVLRAVYHLSRGAKGADPRQARLGRWALGQYVLLNPENANPAARLGMLERFLADNQSAEDIVELATSLAARDEHVLALRAWRDLTERDRYQQARKAAHFSAAAESALRLGDTTKARAFLAAALAFEDGGTAALDLILLDLVRGTPTEVPEQLEVDSVLKACLVAAGSPARVTAFLARRLAANPEDLPCRIIRAAVDPQAAVSPLVAELTGKGNPLLLPLVALLEKPACGRLAVEIAEEIVRAHADNPLAHVLHAKALMRADRGTAAHLALNRAGKTLQTDPLLMAAALDVLVGTDSQFLRGTKVMDQLLSIVMQRSSAVPAAVMATVVRHHSVVLQVPGVREQILPLVAKFWISHPDVAGIGLAEAAILVDADRLQDALNLLPKLEGSIPPAQRSAYLELYYRAASAFCAKVDPTVSKPFLEGAVARLQQGEVHGAPLHFALGIHDRTAARESGTPKGAEARQLALAFGEQFLNRHIESYFAGTDPNLPNLIATVTRIAGDKGHAQGLEAVDAILRRDPSLVPLWRLRASWLVLLDRPEAAARSLLWLPRYLHSPETLDQLIQLLARAGTLVEQGESLLADRGLANASRFSLGLVQLRLGTYLPAAQAMKLAQPQPDGAHLYFRAMALLAVHNPEASDEARKLLVQFAADYPNSTYGPSASTVLAVL